MGIFSLVGFIKNGKIIKMLKKKNRLTTNEFETVFKNGKKTFSPLFLITFLEVRGQKKISVAISKKTEKTAVARVDSRRKVYKILQENFSDIVDNINVTILITKPIRGMEDDQLQKELLIACQRGKILN